MIFSQELRDDVLAGEITVSFRLWKRPKVKVGGRYPVGPGQGLIEIDGRPVAVETSASGRQATLAEPVPLPDGSRVTVFRG